MLSRRQFLATAGTLVSASALSGCAQMADVLGLGPTLRVAVSWSATELEAFRAVLHGLGARGIDLVPLGDDIETALGPASGRYGRRPDVVMLPRPGLVADHLDTLAALPKEVVDVWNYPPLLRQLLWYPNLEADTYRPYGVPFKLAHKSMVWYRRDILERFTSQPPATWSDWLKLNGDLAAAGMPAFALGAADGWVLTDIFENVLLGIAPDVYARLEGPAPRPWADRAVYHAFRLVGRLWAGRRVLAGGAEGSLARQFPEAVVEALAHRRAAMVIAADYAELVVRRFVADPDEVGVFAFPEVDGVPGYKADHSAQPLVVGGDIAVATRLDDQVVNLILQLASPQAPIPWINGYGGFLAAQPGTAPRLNPPTARYAVELRALAEELAVRLNASDQRVKFDLSDQLGALGGSDGLWHVLRGLLVRVVADGEAAVDQAAEDACGEMGELESRLMAEGS